jgi:hypothetical protein
MLAQPLEFDRRDRKKGIVYTPVRPVTIKLVNIVVLKKLTIVTTPLRTPTTLRMVSTSDWRWSACL